MLLSDNKAAHGFSRRYSTVGFDTRRSGAPAGRIEPFEYDSDVTGTRRKANVYLPPG